MNQHLERNCEGIDAAIFSGDVLHAPENREKLREYIARWVRALDEEDAIVDDVALAAHPAAPAKVTDEQIAAAWKSWPQQAISSAAKAIDFVRSLNLAPAKVLVPDDVWLIAVGDDGMHSRLVIGWVALRRAWLDAHYSLVDHDNLDDQERETLALLDDEDEWVRDGRGDRFQLSVHYEGDWVRVTRVTDSSALATHNGLTLGTDGDGGAA
jgi:hypothetical protein